MTETGIPSYNPETDNFTIIGNMFDMTVRISSPDATRYYGLSADDYSLLKSYEPASGSGTHIPGLSFTSPYDRHVRPRF